MLLPLVLFATALAVRAAVGMSYPHPAYPDSFYYVNVARELAAGHGLQVDYVWNFVDVGGRLPPTPVLPIPSNAHWMPLATLIQVPFIWALGASPVVHALPFWLIGAAAAPLAFWIALDAGLSARTAFAAGLLVAFPGALAQFMAQPDNFALYMPLGALALWCCGRGIRGHRRAFVLGGAVVGLATLSRNDGVLLGVPFALAFLVEQWRRQRTSTQPREPGPAPVIGWRAALGCAVAFAAIAGPWYLRQLVVFGSLSPSAENGRILWIRNYGELFSASTETTIATFLSQGPTQLLASRAGGLAMALVIFAGIPLLLYLAPFTTLGAWLRRRDPLVLPWLAYAATLFAFNGLLFAIHVPFGTFLHSAVALVPHAYVLALAGIAAAISWVAQRRRHWDVRRATRNFTAAAVAFMIVGAVAATARSEVTWRREVETRVPIFSELARRGPGERVMSPDAGAYRYHAGNPGIVTPNDPLPVVEQALRAYGVRWLVLEREYLVPSLEPVLRGETQPDWLSEPVVTVRRPASPDPSAPQVVHGPAPTDPSSPVVAALFAVCFAPEDERCAT